MRASPEQVSKAAAFYLQQKELSLDKAGKRFGTSGEAVRKYLIRLEEKDGKRRVRERSTPFRKCGSKAVELAVQRYIKGQSVISAAEGPPRVSHENLRQLLHDKNLIRTRAEGISIGQRLRNRRFDG
jgi:hypothetical protein